MNKIVDVLINRDGMTKAEAQKALNTAKERLLEGEDPQAVLEEEFGLEPDYVFDLL